MLSLNNRNNHYHENKDKEENNQRRCFTSADGEQKGIPATGIRWRCSSGNNWHNNRWLAGFLLSACYLLLTSSLALGNNLQNNNNNIKYPNRPPRFLIDGHSEIVLRLKEGPDTPAGSLIYTLRGADPDNDPLVFGIRDTGYGSDVLRIENIGNNQANLYLTQELDREVGSFTIQLYIY